MTLSGPTGVRGASFRSSIPKSWEGLISGRKAGLHVGDGPVSNPSPVLGSTARDQAWSGVVGGPTGMYDSPIPAPGKAALMVRITAFQGCSRDLDL